MNPFSVLCLSSHIMPHKWHYLSINPMRRSRSPALGSRLLNVYCEISSNRAQVQHSPPPLPKLQHHPSLSVRIAESRVRIHSYSQMVSSIASWGTVSRPSPFPFAFQTEQSAFAKNDCEFSLPTIWFFMMNLSHHRNTSICTGLNLGAHREHGCGAHRISKKSVCSHM